MGTVAGPPFFSALKSDLGDDQVAVQGVDYPASTAVSFRIRLLRSSDIEVKKKLMNG